VSRARHALHRRARCRLTARGHPAEPGDDLYRGARGPGQGCPPDLEATARTPHRGWDRLKRADLSDAEHRGGGDMRHRRIAVGLVGLALMTAACSPGATTAPATAGAASAPASTAPSTEASASPATVGEGEGQLNLVAWPAYV